MQVLAKKVCVALSLTAASQYAAAQSEYCAQRISTGLTGSQCFPTLVQAEAFLKTETIPARGNKFLEPVDYAVLGANRVSIGYRVRDRRYESFFGDWFFAWNYGGGTRDCGTRVPLSGIVNYGCADEGLVINALLSGYPYTGQTSGGTTGDYGPAAPTQWHTAGYDTATGRSYVVVYNPIQKALRILNSAGTLVSQEPLNRNDYYACPSLYEAMDSSLGRWPLVCRLNSSGNITVTSKQYGSCAKDGNPCVAATGNKEYRDTDFEWEGSVFGRAYNSIRDFSLLSGMGDNWAHSYSDRLLMRSNVSSDMIWLRNDGYLESFYEAAPSLYRSRNVPGLVLSRESDAVAAVSGRWKLVATDGRISWFDDAGRLKQIRNGAQQLALAYCSLSDLSAGTCPSPDSLVSVVSSTGRRLDFDYTVVKVSVGSLPAEDIDAARLTRIRANGVTVAEYGYDNAGRMTSSKMGGVLEGKQYLYAEADRLCRDASGAVVSACDGQNFPHHLTGVLDETGTRVATYTYDGSGRATGSERGGSSGAVRLAYPSGSSAEVTLPSGTKKTYQFDGGTFRKPVSTVLSSATQLAAVSTTSQSYADGLLTSSISEGVRTCRAYDVSRGLELVRVDGLAGTQGCGIVGAVAALPTGARKTSTQWHPDWPFEVRRIEPKRATTWVYNGQPDPFNGNAIASCAPTAGLLPDGKPIPVLCKKVEQATTDGSGAIAFGMEASGTDSSFDNVSLLLHMDGINGSSEFFDSSQKNSVVAFGDAKNLSNQGKFGAGAVFDGTGDYLSVPGSSALEFGSGDFTVEAWVKFNFSSGSYTVFQKRTDSGVYAYSVSCCGGGSKMAVSGYSSSSNTWLGFSMTGTTTITPNVWHHVAFTRQGNTLRLFVDGVLDASISYGTPMRSGINDPLLIGSGSGSGGLIGMLDEVRVTKGLARYTSAFTVPSAPFGDSVSGTGASGVPLQSDIAPRVQTWTYDSAGRTLTYDGPRTDVNDTTTFSYYGDTAADHAPGDLRSVTNPVGHVTQYTAYDTSGRLLKSVDANGAVTENEYNPRGWLMRVSVTPVGGGSALVTSYGYDVAGRLTTVTYPGQGPITYGYDAAHRLTSITDAAGNSVTYTLDNAGNRLSETTKDPGGALARTITRAFDALNRVQSVSGGSL